MKIILIIIHLTQNQDFSEAQNDWLFLTGRNEDQGVAFRITHHQNGHCQLKELAQGSGVLCSVRHTSSIYWIQGRSGV